MATIRAAISLISVLSVGLVVLYLFFVLMGAVSVGDPLWLTIVVALGAVFAAVHAIRLRRMVSDHQHDDLARAVHSLRERRGF